MYGGNLLQATLTLSAYCAFKPVNELSSCHGNVPEQEVVKQMVSSNVTAVAVSESVIPLDREVEISIQCFKQEENVYWRVEIRLADEILHARMFLERKDALSFAREMQESFAAGRKQVVDPLNVPFPVHAFN